MPNRTTTITRKLRIKRFTEEENSTPRVFFKTRCRFPNSHLPSNQVKTTNFAWSANENPDSKYFACLPVSHWHRHILNRRSLFKTVGRDDVDRMLIWVLLPYWLRGWRKFSRPNALWNHEETMQSLVFVSVEYNSEWILILRKCHENLQQRVAGKVC